MIALIAVFAVILVVSILDQTGDTPPSLPQVESDAGFRVALLSVRESPEGEIVLIFRVEDERPDEPPAIEALGGLAADSDLEPAGITILDLPSDSGSSPTVPVHARDVEVRLFKTGKSSRSVEFAFSELLFSAEPASIPIKGRWEFTFDPDMAIAEQE